MDPLIRAARLAASRTRLTVSPVTAPGQTTASAPQPMAASHAESIAQIEKRLRAELAAEAERLFESERRKGHAEGYAEGLADAQIQLREARAQAEQEAKESFANARKALEEAQAAVWTELRSSVGTIAFAAVCRIAGARATSPEFVRGIVESTCANLHGDLVATAHMNPEDIECLAGLNQLDREGEDVTLNLPPLRLKLVADPALARGSCTVIAASGSYVGGLSEQLRRLHEALVGAGSPADGVAAGGSVE